VKLTSSTVDEQTGRLALTSDDGVLTFELRACNSGVVMKRTRHRFPAGLLVHEVYLPSVESLVQWCEQDHLRFDYPLLLATLRRDGSDLFLPRE